MMGVPRRLKTDEEEQVEVTATEDLMREHGVLKRILLIYDAIRGHLAGDDPSELSSAKSTLLETALLAKQFVEDYHQKLEENYVFPEFIQARLFPELIQTLLVQHDAARYLTGKIMTDSVLPGRRYELYNLLSAYIRMYEPHSAREDTVVFPLLRSLVDPQHFRDLGEKFEEIETQTFGENGFQHIVNQVALIEERLGIYDLRQFTPALPHNS